MRERTFEHIADDLHVAVWMGAETGTGCHPVVVDHAQGGHTHVCGVVVAAEREGVVAVEPAEVGMAAVGRGAQGDHVCSPG
ncbi:hypothetical protein SDC9_136538 [bioreactor metagenome]|uniref:Uncharacterized protein n=1 Tax=bioreactor metagenome TaxID=1076179 RepID=A0A645DJD7_9ZZZZ